MKNVFIPRTTKLLTEMSTKELGVISGAMYDMLKQQERECIQRAKERRIQETKKSI